MNAKTSILSSFDQLIGKRLLSLPLALTLLTVFTTLSSVAQTAVPVIRGDFNVSGGQATYSLPIDVVPGRNGHQPSLAISYASDSPNGYLGMGWNISGLSAITRCGKNLHKDGRWGGVRLNNDDRYCLDGQRLVAIEGQDGGDSTEYRLENNGYSKIVSFKSNYNGHGPSHFKVWKKDGSVYEYGMENTAQVNLPGQTHIYKWALNKITDHTKNNHITFKYDENTAAGIHKIDVISYEGGSIKFDYVGRTDSTSQYLMGSKLTISQRLSKIVVNDQSEQAVRNYILAYSESGATNRSLLSSIQMCTGKGTECSSPVSFEWNSHGNTAVTRSNTSFIFPKFVDTDRDGYLDKYGIKRGWDQIGTEYCEFNKPDFVGWTVVDPYGNETTKSTGNYQLISDNGTFKIEAELGEISGSGSICGGGNNLKKKEFTATAKKRGPCVRGTYVKDINGNTGTYCRGKFSVDRNGNGIQTVGNGSFVDRTVNPYVLDFDGDGKDDYISFDTSNRKKLYLFTSGANYLKREKTLRNYIDHFRFADINNDGYLDFISLNYNSFDIYLYTGTGLEHSYSRRFNRHGEIDPYFLDWNADGYPDLYFRGNIYRNNRGVIDLTENGKIKRGISDFHSAVDINSDGKIDILTGAKEAEKTIQISTPYALDKVKTITEDGLVYTVNYKSASDHSVHIQSPYSHYPVLNSTPTRYLVSGVTKKPKGYNSTTYEYRYEGAKSHKRGLGFLGFDKVTVTESGDVITKTTSEFMAGREDAANFDLRQSGKPSKVLIQKKKGASGTFHTAKETTYSYSAKSKNGINGVKYHEVYASSVVVNHHDSDGTQLKTTTTTTKKDENGFGNVTERTTVVEGQVTNSGSFTTKDVFDYVSNSTTISDSDFWQIGAIKKSTQSITDNTSGDTKTTVSNFEYTTTGLLKRQTITPTAYHAGGVSGRKLVTDYGYDVYGNVTSQSVSGSDLASRTTLTTYDGSGLYIDYATNAKGHRTEYTFDGAGRLKDETAPNGRKVSYQYDKFGRVIKETHGNPNNFVTYNYLGAAGCGFTDTETLRCVKTTSNQGGESWVQLDFAGREVRSGVKSFDGRISYTDTQWDRDGRKTSVSRPYFQYDTVFHVQFEYDSLNREIRKEEPSATGGVTLWKTEYSGFSTTLTDVRGFEHKTTTNVLGHIVKKEEAIGKADYSYQTYAYFPDGKLKTSIDSKGNSTKIEYDNLGYRSKLDDPDLGVWAYKYNAAGELLQKKDANGVITTYSYDALGRKVRQKDGSSAASTWVYDGRGTASLGALTSISGHGSNSEFYYHTNGLLAEKATFVDGDKFSTLYTYDVFERLSREVRPNGQYDPVNDAPVHLHDAFDADKYVEPEYMYDDEGHIIGLAPRDYTVTLSPKRLAIDYVYNRNGYLEKIQSPYTYADVAFASPSYREEIQELISEALKLSRKYSNLANRYYQQSGFFGNKHHEYMALQSYRSEWDTNSAKLLLSDNQKWCDEYGNCYLRPVNKKWVILHGEVIIPIEVKEYGDFYELQAQLTGDNQGQHYYANSFVKTNLTEDSITQLELSLKGDYNDLRGDLFGGGQDPYHENGLRIDVELKENLDFTAQELSLAAEISQARYFHYHEMAIRLLQLVEKVTELGDIYQNVQTDSTRYLSHLETLKTNSELAEASKSGAYQIYWQRRETDAYGHTLSETLGNGLVNTYYHSASTGKPMIMTTHKQGEVFSHQYKDLTGKKHGFVGLIDATRWLEYKYDDHNNVTQRYDQSLGIRDYYTYDGLDRVKTNNIVFDNGSNHANVTKNSAFSYDSIGNILSKTGVSGTYEYSNIGAGPHAVTKANGLKYQYDAVGNMVSAKRSNNSTERTLSWTAFNKPSEITRNGKTVSFSYDANHNRYKKVSGSQTTIYIDKTYERVTDVGTDKVQHQHFVYAEGKLIALNTQTENTNGAIVDKQVRFLHYDALNSVDMVTDLYGYVVDRRSYDAFGKQRDVVWQLAQREDKHRYVNQLVLTNRGYTGHEEIEEVGLIHMNGRVYDQTLGRFVSADPIIQAPYVTNSFNRYAYVMNNPLKYTDPTGHYWEDESGHGATGECLVDGTSYDGIDGGSSRWDTESHNKRNRDREPSTYHKLEPAMTPIQKRMAAEYQASIDYLVNPTLRQSHHQWRIAKPITEISVVFVVEKGKFVPSKYDKVIDQFLDSGSTKVIDDKVYEFVISPKKDIVPDIEDITKSGDQIPWGSWSDYKKVNVDGQDYAQVGNRLYSEHAVNRMQPSRRRHSSSGKTGGLPEIYQAGTHGDFGRGVAPKFVEDVISSAKPLAQQNGNFSYTSGSLQVITNPQGAVVTVITK